MVNEVAVVLLKLKTVRFRTRHHAAVKNGEEQEKG